MTKTPLHRRINWPAWVEMRDIFAVIYRVEPWRWMKTEEIDVSLANRSLGWLLVDFERELRITKQQLEVTVDMLERFDPDKSREDWLQEFEQRLEEIDE